MVIAILRYMILNTVFVLVTIFHSVYSDSFNEFQSCFNNIVAQLGGPWPPKYFRFPYKYRTITVKRPRKVTQKVAHAYKGPLRKEAPKDKGPSQTMSSYRQGVHTDKGPLHTKDPYERF